MKGTTALAVLLPVGLFGGGMWALSRPGSEQLSPKAQAMEEMLRAADPQIVLVGNSTVGAGVDTTALAELTGRRVASAHENATGAVTWYTVLENRVFEAGLRPELVVIGSFAAAMLLVEPGQLERETLAAHSSRHEPVVSRLSYGKEARPLWQVDQERRRTALRQVIIDGVRGVAGRLSGAADFEASVSAVFDAEDAIDLDLRRNVMPIVDVKGRESAAWSGGKVPASEGYLPAFLDLAEQHGAKVVVVRFPLRTGSNADNITAEQLNELIELLNERGAGWIDLSQAELGVRHFRDPLHVNRHGQKLLTQQLATALAELGALDDGELKQAWQVRTAPPQRQGALPPPMPLKARATEGCSFQATLPSSPLLEGLGRLQQLGLARAAPLQLFQGDPRAGGVPLTLVDKLPSGCEGEALFGPTLRFTSKGEAPASPDFWLAWREEAIVEDGLRRRWTWVAPGSRVLLTLDSKPPPDDVPLELQAQVLLVNDQGQIPRLLAGGEEAQAERDRSRVRLRVPLPAGALQGLQVELSLPDDAPPVLLEGLRIRAVPVEGEASTSGLESWLIGSNAVTAPGRARYLGSRWTPGRFEAPPPALTVGAPVRDEQGEVVIPVPGLKGIDGKRAGFALRKKGATPLTLLLDGQPVEAPPVLCEDLSAAPEGAWCHQVDEVRVRAPSAHDPARYSLVLDPDRGASQRWLYPGDRVSLSGSSRDLSQVRGGATGLTLKGRALPVEGSAPDAELHATVSLRGEPIFEADIPLSSFTGQELALPFSQAAPPLSVPVIHLSLPADAPYLLLEEVGLNEGLPLPSPPPTEE